MYTAAVDSHRRRRLLVLLTLLLGQLCLKCACAFVVRRRALLLQQQLSSFNSGSTVASGHQNPVLYATKSPDDESSENDDDADENLGEGAEDASSSTESSSSASASSSFHTDDEWHPHDPAETTPQLLSSIWLQIAQAGTMNKGESMTVIYPQMQPELSKPRYLNLLLSHLDVCKDVCDHFGISTTLVPYKKDGKIVGFTSKSFRNPKNAEDDYEFGYDPFWDDGTDFDSLYQGVDDQDLEKGDAYPQIENRVPDDDDEIIETTKRWVDRMMSDMGICPFTQGSERAGLPLGDVYYCVDRSTTPEDMYERYWKEVVRLEHHSEQDQSTSLLIAPEFFLDNVELFESFSTTLTQSLTALGVEDFVQLVFFHPQWSFRDGSARAGEGQAANYARRSPWPMINILRTNQVRAAQKGIPTGLVYKQNEKTLSSIGVDKLETMLRLRDWSDIADLQVNRREMDALKIAQDFQATGTVEQKDMSLEHDATPAANKVDRRQVEEGDLVKVVMQALEKRLGKSGPVEPLSGPETSATAMGVDFLLQELDRIAETASERPKSLSETKPKVGIDADTKKSDDKEERDERQERMEAARRALMEDFIGETQQGPSDRGDEMTDVLFGKGGIPDRPDETFGEGMDPDSFY